MKIKVPRKEMIQVLSVGGSMAGKSKTLPILNCVKITLRGLRMIVSSYDGKNSITKIFQVEESEGDTCFCVDYKDLFSLLRSIRDTSVTFETDEYNIRIIHKKGVQSLPLENASEYPEPMREKTDEGFTLASDFLYDVVNTARNFAQSNELHPQMSGIYIGIGDGTLDVAATDGFSLFSDFVSFENDEPRKEATININTIAPLLDMIADTSETHVCIGERNISFKTEDAILVSAMAEYKYPNYKAIIPRDHTIEIKTDRMEFLDTLSRVMLTANKESCLIKISTEGMFMNVISEDFCTSKKSKESLMCDKSGDDITINIKGSYLKTCLEQVKSEKVVLRMSHPTRPVVMKDDFYENRDIVLMPMAN